MIGTIKRFNTEAGYGFIAPDDGSGDVSFHERDFERAGLSAPKLGDRIQFDPVRNSQRPQGRR